MSARLLSFHPAPAGSLYVLAFWQGGGLYVIHSGGTATLTNTNVYGNQADHVCSPFEHSLNFIQCPLERYACSCLAGWRGTRNHGHGNANQHQRVRESG